MIQMTSPPWEAKRTDETRLVEKSLRDAGFDQVDAYRYNTASIRLRVIDRRFEGLSAGKRLKMIERHLDELPESTQADIINVFIFSPSELAHPEDLKSFAKYVLKNIEFEDPIPSM